MKNVSQPRPKSGRMTNFVYKVLDFIPWFSVRQKIKYDARIFNLENEVYHLNGMVKNLYQDIEKMMYNDLPPSPSAHIKSYDYAHPGDYVEYTKFSIEYEPVNCHIMKPSVVERGELHYDDITKYYIKEVAHNLAQEESRQREQQIYDTFMKQQGHNT